MKKIISMFLAVSLVLGAMAIPVSAAEAETGTTPAFADVDPDAWYAEAVNTLATNGIVKGGPDGLFHPDDPVTFAELYTMFYRLYGAETFMNETYGSLEAYCEQENTTRIIGGSRGYGDRCIWIYKDGKPYHWAAYAWMFTFDREIGTPLYMDNMCEPEDIDLPVPRAAAIASIYRLMTAMNNECPDYYHDLTPVHDYTPDDIPDWEDVLGDHENHPRCKYGVLYLDGNLNFGYKDWLYEVRAIDEVDYAMGQGVGRTDYDYAVVAFRNPLLRPLITVDQDQVLAAYNVGLTDGVDANHTCNPNGKVTRAEICAMLYRAGMTREFTAEWFLDWQR